MNDQKNMLLAVVLSVLVLLGWSYVSEQFFPTPAPAPAPKVATAAAPAAQPSAPATAAPRAPRLPAEAIIARGGRVAIRTPALSGSINLQGARIDDLVLTRYRQSIKAGAPNIRLFAPSGSRRAYFAQFGWTGSGVLPPADAVWTASARALTPTSPVTLSWTSPAGARFEIRLTVDEKYLFTAEQRIVNAGAAPLVVRPYTLIARDHGAADGSALVVTEDVDSWTAHVGPMGVFNDRLADVNYDEVSEAPGQTLNYTSTGGWMGFADTYWLAAVIPDQKVRFEAALRHPDRVRYQADVARDAVVVAPGATSVATTRLFAGAKEVQQLDAYMGALGIPQLDKAIDWGWFYPLPKWLFYLLDWLFRLFGNFGIAIIGLTVIVRLVMFPIANKQYASMARMRVLAPKLKELQERYKDDRARLQQEMMGLYSKEKVNPLAGCLPILIQIPIFYALYKALLLTIEMRHQPFVLWIRDLSAPDPLTPVNLFGLLPFTPPAFLSIGILTILLGVTMWLQQKLNPQPLDDVQKTMFSIMPWFFMFLMAPFAAGLQLYWVTNNVLSIAQQWLLNRRHGAAAPTAPAKAK